MLLKTHFQMCDCVMSEQIKKILNKEKKICIKAANKRRVKADFRKD